MGFLGKLFGRQEQAPAMANLTVPALTVTGPVLPDLVPVVRSWADGPWPIGVRDLTYRFDRLGFVQEDDAVLIPADFGFREVIVSCFNDSVMEILLPVTAEAETAAVPAYADRVQNLLTEEFGEPLVWAYADETVIAWDVASGARVVMSERGRQTFVAIVSPAVAELQKRYAKGRPGQGWQEFEAGLAETIADLGEGQTIYLIAKELSGLCLEVIDGVGGTLSLSAQNHPNEVAELGWNVRGDYAEKSIGSADGAAADCVQLLTQICGLTSPDALYVRALWADVTPLVFPALGLTIVP